MTSPVKTQYNKKKDILSKSNEKTNRNKPPATENGLLAEKPRKLFSEATLEPAVAELPVSRVKGKTSGGYCQGTRNLGGTTELERAFVPYHTL